jgi:hypothetical protein
LYENIHQAGSTPPAELAAQEQNQLSLPRFLAFLGIALR